MDTYLRILFYIFTYISLFTAVLYFVSFFVNRKNLKADEWKGPLPIVTVIIPAYNEEKSIAKTIDSVLALDYPRDKLDIIVIDDGSKDKTYKIASTYSKFNVRVFTKTNGGKGSAMNLGIKKARGQFIATMDADSFVSKNALNDMIGYFNDKKVACTTASLLIKDPKGFWLRIQAVEYAFGIYLRKAFSLIEAVHVTPGPFSVYRKSFFDKYGSFDEHNITEDTEMGLRIQSKGYKIRSSMEAVIYTIGPNNFTDLFYQRRRWYSGFLENVLKYKNLFSSAYGELGLIILPISLLSVFSATVLAVYFLYTTINSLIDLIRYEMSINFHIFANLGLNSDRVILFLIENFSEPLFFTGLLGTLFFIYMLVMVKRKTKQKLGVLIGFWLFIIFYVILFSFWYAISIFNVIFLKNKQWRREQNAS